VNGIDDEIHQIGAGLVQYADESAEFSARGVLGELFPYIYQASRRMSTRAISRWLAEGPKIKLSAVSIAKALRSPEKYWQQFAEFVEPQARIVEEALDWSMEEFLYNTDSFLHVIDDPETKPKISGDSQDEMGRSLGEYEAAVGFLKDKWFSLDTSVRDNCWRYFHSDGEEKE
jgi:hypothetical protein